MALHYTEIVIIGGGMVGLCVAHQLLERKITTKIIIVEKENKIGKHSSGRNSGVLHSGLYYSPLSLKAKVCIEGARRLKLWIKERGLPINMCGKIIVPQEKHLDSQLDILEERGKANGANVKFIDNKELIEKIPYARTSSGRALWSPQTSVINPRQVIGNLEQELKNKGVYFYYNENNWTVDISMGSLKMKNGDTLKYDHLINCAGLQADKVAEKFGIGKKFIIIPFKGNYWQLKKTCPIKFNTNLYPVPDLNMPFLGVHFTPNIDKSPVISIGPTATPAWGRENYLGLESIEPKLAIRSLGILVNQYSSNKNGFRRYVHEQAFLTVPPLLLKSAQKLIPSLKSSHIERSKKIGIRSQLFNKNEQKLENDFLCLHGEKSTHILNAISPAFTASFALADLIIDKSKLK